MRAFRAQKMTTPGLSMRGWGLQLRVSLETENAVIVAVKGYSMSDVVSRTKA